MAQYLARLTKTDFGYKTLTDLRTGDHARLMNAIPEPYVKDKHYSVQGYAKYTSTP
jgi:hypothetical protein